MKVSPSILSCDFSKLAEDIVSVDKYVEYLHIDIMDGIFVPNISFGPMVVKSIKEYSNSIFDTHLMIDNPIEYIKAFSDAGSDIITFHLESKSDITSTINEIKKYKKRVGLSIKPNTKIEDLIPYLKDIDLVLVMSVEPGFGGQEFMHNSVDKIKFLNNYRNDNKLSYLISVDGGINDKTIGFVKNTGCDIVVAGSYVFNSSNREEKIKSLM